MFENNLFGFRKQGKDKIMVLSPTWFLRVGIRDEIIRFCNKKGKDFLTDSFDRIQSVSYTDPFMDEDEEKMSRNQWKVDYNDKMDCLGAVIFSQNCKDFKNLDSYSIFEKMLSVPYPYIVDQSELILNSNRVGMCYLVNLDEDILEIWQGAQKNPDCMNRYGQNKSRHGYPCRLVQFIPLWEKESLCCPKCNTELMESESSYACPCCDFHLFKTFLGHKFAENEISDLFAEKVVEVNDLHFGLVKHFNGKLKLSQQHDRILFSGF